MKTFSIIALLLALLAAGCQHPNEVEVPQDKDDPQLEVTSLAMVDTTVYQAAIDSLAVMPADQDRFAGLLLVNNVKFDGGTRWGMQSAAYAAAQVIDRSRPLQAHGKVFGYYGLRLMAGLLDPLRINGLAMLEIAHRVRVGMQQISFGHQYVRDVSSIYQPDMQFTWSATPDSLGPVEVSVRSPADLVVASPVGGSIISRNRDLKLLWTGQGEMTIILSAYNPLAKKARPLLRMRPLANKGRARVSSAILRALPADNFYVFTFIVANRNEATVSRGPELIPVLAQAASVHNIYVEIQ